MMLVIGNCAQMLRTDSKRMQWEFVEKLVRTGQTSLCTVQGKNMLVSIWKMHCFQQRAWKSEFNANPFMWKVGVTQTRLDVMETQSMEMEGVVAPRWQNTIL